MIEAASRPMIAGDPQPQLLPSTRARTSAVSPVVRVRRRGSRPPCRRWCRATRGPRRGGRDGTDRDRDIEVEDRPPGDVLGEQAAERPGRSRGPGRRPRPRCPSPCRARGGEGVGDDRERARHHQPRADALDDTADDERGLVGGEAGGRRGEGEDDDADQEDEAAAEDVAEAPAGREDDGEGQRVAAGRPLEARDRSVQVSLDRRQCDVHDRVVEHDHEQREAHRPERPPLAVVVGYQVPVSGHRVESFPFKIS